MEEKKDEIIEQKPVSEEEFKEKIHSVAEANRKSYWKTLIKGLFT